MINKFKNIYCLIVEDNATLCFHYSHYDGKIKKSSPLKAYLPYFLSTDTTCPTFNRKLQGMPTGKKEHSLERQHNKQKTDSLMTQALELSDKEIK